MIGKDDGGPAFPVCEEALVRNLTGASLRDYFAGQALAGFCASSKVDIAWLREHCVPSCYQLADAMLKERNK